MSSEDSPGKDSICSSSTDGDPIIDESKTLFVGDLQSSAQNAAQLITELFSENICHIDVKVVDSTKGRLCYAFVTFASAEAAQSAVAKFSSGSVTLSDGTVSRIGWARRNSRLHVSNLDENTSEDTLAKMFSQFGELDPTDGVLIMKKSASSPTNSQPVCYGVVHFMQRDCAESAKMQLHGTYLEGRRLRVEWNRASKKSQMTRLAILPGENGTTEIVEMNHSETSSPRRNSPVSSPVKSKRTSSGTSSPASFAPTPVLSQPQAAEVPPSECVSSRTASDSTPTSASASANAGTIVSTPASAPNLSSSLHGHTFGMSMIGPVISIYVQFETIDAEARVTESLITEVFQPFGNMTGCYIKTNNTSVSGLRQHGYAFVHFENTPDGKKSALAAAAMSKEAPIKHSGVLFHAEVSKNFRRATSSIHGGNNNGRSFHGSHHQPYFNGRAQFYSKRFEEPPVGEDATIQATGSSYYPEAEPYMVYGGPGNCPAGYYGYMGYGYPGCPSPAYSGGKDSKNIGSGDVYQGYAAMIPYATAVDDPSAGAASVPPIPASSAGNNTPVSAAASPYYYSQPYYMPPMPYGPMNPMMFPTAGMTAPFQPPGTPYPQSGLAASVVPGHVQPSIVPVAGDSHMSDESGYYSASVTPSQLQGTYPYMYPASASIASQGSGPQYYLRQGSSGPPNTSSGSTAAPSAPGNSTAPRQIADPSATPSVSQTQAQSVVLPQSQMHPHQVAAARQAYLNAGPYSGYGAAMGAAGAVVGNNGSAGPAHVYDPSSVAIGYYSAAGMTGYGGWHQN